MKYKQLFQKNGFLNMEKIIDLPVPFIFVIGARGTGKTYGAIRALYDRGEPCIFMRRTQAQCDMISKQQFSPLRTPMEDMGLQVKANPIGKSTEMLLLEADGETPHWHVPFCVNLALSTIGNLRGFDASFYNYILYDEFIPEPTARPIKHEAQAFYNAYETINRNRELFGKSPVKLVCMANSFNVANPIFMDLGIVMTAYKMSANGGGIHIDEKRNLALVVLGKTPISQKKSNTALYSLTGKESEFGKMALDNVFVSNVADNVRPSPLIEYKPLVFIGELAVYRHKSKEEWYCTSHKSGTAESYDSSGADVERFYKKYVKLYIRYLERKIFFETYMEQVLFEKYFKKGISS